MKLHPQILILCFLFAVSSNMITAASAENPWLMAQSAHNKGIDFAAFEACAAFQKKVLSSPEDPTISVHKKTVQSILGTGILVVFASQGIHQARAAIAYNNKADLSVGKYHQPSPSQLLAGFAQLPGDTSAAEKELDRLYDCKSIPNSKRKPFDGFDEKGNWKKFPLPGHLIDLKACLNDDLTTITTGR